MSYYCPQHRRSVKDGERCPECPSVFPDTKDELADEPIFDAASSGAMREKLAATPFDLIPYQELSEAYARVAEHGATKYAPWNWSKGLPRVQLISSLLRHTFAYLRGEERDKDSGLLHTDHILWNAVALCHNVHWDLEDGRRIEPERGYKSQKIIRKHFIAGTFDPTKDKFG